MLTLIFFILFCLKATIICESKCPFRYKCLKNFETNCFGELELFGLKVNEYYKIGVTLESSDRISYENAGSITLLGTKRQINKKLENNESLVFKINFPPGSKKPWVNNIILNDKAVCIGRPQEDIKSEIILSYNLDTSKPKNLSIPLELVQRKIPICGQRKIVTKQLILNGYDTYPGKWPFHVAIYQIRAKQRLYACGGTLIGEFHILTAAHCVMIGAYTLTPSAVIIQLGVFNLDLLISETLQEHGVRKILVHPKYKSVSRNDDISIIFLNTKVKFTQFVQPICLYNQQDTSSFPKKGRIGTTIGWGRTETDELASILKEIRIPFVDFNECLNSNRDVFGRFLSVEMFCAGNRNGSNVCDGDSGGGMYIYENGAWNLVGVVAFTAQNNLRQCSSQDFAVFMDVSQYFDWIKQQAEILITTNFDELEATKRDKLVDFYRTNYFLSAPRSEIREFINKIGEIEGKQINDFDKFKEKEQLEFELLKKYPYISKGSVYVKDFLISFDYYKKLYPNAPKDELANLVAKRTRVWNEYVDIQTKFKQSSIFFKYAIEIRAIDEKIKKLDPISAARNEQQEKQDQEETRRLLFSG